MARGFWWKLVLATLVSAALTFAALSLPQLLTRVLDPSPESPPISIDFRGCRILIVPPPKAPRVMPGPLVPRGGASPEVQAEQVW